MEGINAKYVSKKISKTRWRPVSSSSLQQPDIFATGSWDNEDNSISIWSIGENGVSIMDDEFEGDPQLVCEYKHNGDVLDLQFLDQDRIVTASSTGAVTIFQHHHNSQTLSVSQLWDRAHHYPCDNAPCTGVVCNSPEIVTVGEDGRIMLFRADQEGVLRTIEKADSSAIHAVTFLRTTEILTVNSIGQLKLWDFRQPGNEPSQILSLTGDRVPLHCVDRHPNQQHIVATGGQDGMLCIWDVRQGNMPFSLMEAHSAESKIFMEVVNSLKRQVDLQFKGFNSCFCCAHSVGGPFSSIKPRPPVLMLRGWITVALGDFFKFRHTILLKRWTEHKHNFSQRNSPSRWEPVPHQCLAHWGL
uniref:Nucleoporin 43 n=1 Tax=Hucho hucho TaxID=62062 RepID=A0A4W5MWR5_9TELE